MNASAQPSVDTPVGGRTTCRGVPSTAKYFGVLPLATLPGLPAVSQRFPDEWSASAPALRLFRVTSTVRERQRFTGGTLNPLTVDQIFSEDVVAGGVLDFADRSCIKLRISLGGLGFQKRDFLLDVGQSIDVYAEKVDVDWVGPANFVESPGATAVAGPGVVVDGILGVRVFGVEVFGNPDALLTSYVSVAVAPASVAIPIPRGARDVTIYQAAGVDIQTQASWNYGSGIVVGIVNFVPTLRRTESISVVPGATHLSIPGLPTATNYLVVWTIRP